MYCLEFIIFLFYVGNNTERRKYHEGEYGHVVFKLNIYIPTPTPSHTPPTLQFKGSLARDFRHQHFSRISFPLAPEYPLVVISNFYENSQRLTTLCSAGGQQYRKHIIAGVVGPLLPAE